MYIEADPTNGDSHIAFRGARYLPQPPPNSEILDALKELGAFASIRLFSLLFFRFSACLVGWLLLDNARITAPPHGSEPTVPDSESAFKAFRTGAPVVALAIAFAAGAMALKSDVSEVRVRATPRRWDLEVGRGRGRGRGQAAMAAMMASGPALSAWIGFASCVAVTVLMILGRGAARADNGRNGTAGCLLWLVCPACLRSGN